ncbi:MAG: SpoIIE family protein phosphatase [candidate division KSB1 bacterium]|nr:SpoIIE family protein phosphatase [candidate division KSB1 bacterium]
MGGAFDLPYIVGEAQHEQKGYPACHIVVYLTCGVLIFFLGLLIYRENPKQRINRVTGFMMFLAALGPIMGACGLLMEKATPTLPLDLDFYRRLFLVWEFFFPQLLLFALVFPKENPVFTRHPGLVYLIFFPQAFHFLLVLLFRTPEDILNVINFQTLNEQWGGLLQPVTFILQLFFTLLSLCHEFHSHFFALVNLIYVVVAIMVMSKGYRSSHLKRQVQVVLWGIRASVGLYAIAFLLPKLFPLKTSENFTHALTIMALLIGAGSIAWAIIKYQFLDIRLFIQRSFVFSMTSGLLIGIYLLLYSQARKVITVILGFDLPILEVLFLIVAAVFFQPVLTYIENLVGRFFVREAPDYRNVLQTLSRDILTILNLDQLREKIVHTLSETMGLEEVHLILENKRGDYSTEVLSQDQRQEVHFSRGGEFINLMRSLTEPMCFDEISIRISEATEIENLKTLKAYLLIPLCYRGELEGVLSLGSKLTRSAFSPEDTTLLNVLSGQIAIAVENSKLYQEKLEKQRMEEEIFLAREIQRMLLPQRFPRGKNFEISAINIPSKEVGGDYYDFIEIDNFKIGIAIGDIAGKGIPAALLMSNLQATFRASSGRRGGAAQVMTEVNTQISHTTSPEKYATFFYGIFDSRNLTFTYSNAGHNFPIWYRQKGECKFLREGDLIIGIQPDLQYNEYSIQLQPGEVLIFYTDGVTEALNTEGVEFGEDRLLEVISNQTWNTTEELRNKIFERVMHFTRGTSQHDDLTLVILQVR